VFLWCFQCRQVQPGDRSAAGLEKSGVTSESAAAVTCVSAGSVPCLNTSTISIGDIAAVSAGAAAAGGLVAKVEKVAPADITQPTCRILGPVAATKITP